MTGNMIPLNINQSSSELNYIHGRQDYYWYLRSPQFREEFIKPLANIVNRLGLTCLDVGCSEACLADYLNVAYYGFDGSRAAIEKACERIKTIPVQGRISISVDRFEDPSLYINVIGTIVLGGILEVLVKPEHRVALLQMYQERYNPVYLVIYDLERLDTSEIDKVYGLPMEVVYLHCPPFPPEKNVPDVKLHRKIMVYQCQK
jgi:hypothetical protein